MIRKEIEGEEELNSFVREFAEGFSPQKHALVLALYGELGAGKTTFTQYLAKALGVHEPLASPTYVIEKVYTIPKGAFSQLIHIDAYRLENADELKALGVKQLFHNPDNLIVIEWAEKVSGILPDQRIDIHMEHAGGEKREIVIKLKS